MSNKYDIIYIGSSAIGLQKLVENTFFSVKKVLCLEGRINDNLIKVASAHGFNVTTFKWITDFRELITKEDPETPFFIYQLDMLVPSDLTARYSFYNIHRGNLYTNRGPNPDIWPILNGDKETRLSLHKINEKIDSGILIADYCVEIIIDDDTASVKIKLEEGLPKLIESLKKFIKGENKGTPLAEGVYRPWITEEDFTIELNKDPIEVINRKIKSQRQYNGAILFIKNKKFYVLDILGVQEIQKQTDLFTLDGDCLKVSTSSHIIILKLNLTPKCPPPPVHPPSKRI